MKISYKKLEPQHVRQYREIRLRSLQLHPEAYGSSYEEEASREKLYIEKCIEERNENTFVVGAFDGDKLIGITTVNRYNLSKIAHRAEIIQVFVAPEYRGKKISTDLLNLAIEETSKIKGIEQLELGVATENRAAIAAYRKAGFTETGKNLRCLKIKDQYIDELLMILVL